MKSDPLYGDLCTAISFMDEITDVVASVARIPARMLQPQRELKLLDGFCHGPLFAPEKKERPLVRPHGQQGTVRRRQERDRTPSWADAKAIRALKKEARRLTLETGELHVVDHIVPLIGKQNGIHIVDGLHWEGSMRVIHWKPNNQKGNFWWPDMPFEQMELL